MKYCLDAREKYNLQNGCCDSCHEDFEYDSFYIMDFEVEGETYELCCKVEQELTNLGIEVH